MPREFVICSPDPITVVDCVASASAVDPDLGIGRLWGGGGFQIADERPVLAVLRSAVLAEPGDAERLLGMPLPSAAGWWTEAYGPAGDLTDRVVSRLAADTEGTLVELGVHA